MSSPAPIVPQYVPRRRSLAGPMILIIIGVLLLIGNLHLIAWPSLGHLFARYWPALIIVWGAVRLFEYYNDRQHGYPSRGIGAGGVLLLIFLIIFGMSASQADRVNWQAIQGNIDIGDEDFFGGMFGHSYNFTATLQQDFPQGGTLRVVDDRGDISVNSWDDNRIKISVAKKLRANDEGDAAKVDQSTQPTINVEGNVVTVSANTNGAGQRAVETSLEIWIPRKAMADISTRRGDISVRNRAGDVKANTSHGDIDLEDIEGNVQIDQRKGDVRTVKITGDVIVDGRVDDISVADVSGSVRLNGDYFGSITLSKISKTLTFHSSKTDMEMARLDGDLNMESGDLRASEITGPLRLLTRSKDIHFDGISGDVKVENSNGNVEVHSSKLGSIEIQNQKGDVELVMPAKSNFEAEVRTHNGDISTDFESLKINTHNDDSNAKGAVGTGGPRVQITNEHGNIEIKKAGQS